MADSKISQLNVATPLTGVEVFPIVQSGQTRKLALEDIEINSIPVTKTAFVNLISANSLLTDRVYKITNAANSSAIVYLRAISKNEFDKSGVCVYQNVGMTGSVVFQCVYNLTNDFFDYLYSNEKQVEIILNSNNSIEKNFVENAAWDVYNSTGHSRFINCISGSVLNLQNSFLQGTFIKCEITIDDSILEGNFYETFITLFNSTYRGSARNSTIDLGDSTCNSVNCSENATISILNSTLSNCYIGVGKNVAGSNLNSSNCMVDGNRSTFEETYTAIASGILTIQHPHTGIIKLANNALNNEINDIIRTGGNQNNIDIELVYNGFLYKVKKTANVAVPGTFVEIDNVNNKYLKVYLTHNPTSGTKWVMTHGAILHT